MKQAPPGAEPLVEHAFRHEYGRLVSTLARSVGFQHTELVEDAVQSALVAALRSWPKTGTPDDPSGWLYRVAKNQLTDEFRKAKPLTLDGGAAASGATSPTEATDVSALDLGAFEREIRDDELRMLFVCADPSIPAESQLVLALKVLCGFGTNEIALRLLTTEANVYKRLARARARLRELAPSFDTPPLEALASRRDAVHRMVYLLFNEGYSSSLADRLIRRELCDEAIRLGHLLADHPGSASPETDALLALMYLHAARFDARVDGTGGLLLLEDQDRRSWDRALIGRGMLLLERAASGPSFSRYHAEAAVAAVHCMAPSYAETRWHEIVELYEMLERLAPSPLHTLNRAIAVAEWKGPHEALVILEALQPPAWLLGYYLWDATLGELERRAGNLDRARIRLERAQGAAPHPAEKALLARRLLACTEPSTPGANCPQTRGAPDGGTMTPAPVAAAVAPTR